MTNNINIFNNPVEIRLRILILLNIDIDNEFNIEKLTYFDYLMMHSGDIDNAPDSILPNSPYRFFEFHVNKENISQAVEFLWRKGLVDISYTANGIFYKANRLTNLFVKTLQNDLCEKLKYTASWVVDNFYKYSENDLKEFFYSKLKSKSIDFSKIGAI